MKQSEIKTWVWLEHSTAARSTNEIAVMDFLGPPNALFSHVFPLIPFFDYQLMFLLYLALFSYTPSWDTLVEIRNIRRIRDDRTQRGKF